MHPGRQELFGETPQESDNVLNLIKSGYGNIPVYVGSISRKKDCADYEPRTMLNSEYTAIVHGNTTNASLNDCLKKAGSVIHIDEDVQTPELPTVPINTLLSRAVRGSTSAAAVTDVIMGWGRNKGGGMMTVLACGATTGKNFICRASVEPGFACRHGHTTNDQNNYARIQMKVLIHDVSQRGDDTQVETVPPARCSKTM